LRGERFVLREEVGLLESPPEPPASVAFLAPLDPFMWDRELLRPLYGFDYVWEVYVPEARRRWGYYVLPILYGDRLVGRFEPRIDRTGARVRVLGLWWEDGFDPRRADRLRRRDARGTAGVSRLRGCDADRVDGAPREGEAPLPDAAVTRTTALGAAEPRKA